MRTDNVNETVHYFPAASDLVKSKSAGNNVLCLQRDLPKGCFRLQSFSNARAANWALRKLRVLPAKIAEITPIFRGSASRHDPASRPKRAACAGKKLASRQEVGQLRFVQNGEVAAAEGAWVGRGGLMIELGKSVYAKLKAGVAIPASGP